MTIQFSTAVLNASANAIETSIGTSPLLRIRTGGAPANPAATRTGTILVSITLPADWSGDAANGIKALAGTWSANAIAAGTAGHFEIMNAAGSVCHAQGSVTGTGGGGDVTIQNTNVAVGQTVNFTAFPISAQNLV